MKNSLNIPNHVAIILDGNGRWAKKRGLPRSVGHLMGARNLINTTNIAYDLGIKTLTVYAFSTENWRRDEDEVDYLMNLPFDLYDEYKERLLSNKNVRLVHVGRKERLNKKLLELFNEIEEKTKDNVGITVQIAFDYGSFNELFNAFNQIEKTDDEALFKEELFNALYIKEPVDFLIRTSGEMRLSNFLLLQASYAELYFVKKHWPAFNKRAFIKAIKVYQKRKRTYGGNRT